MARDALVLLLPCCLLLRLSIEAATTVKRLVVVSSAAAVEVVLVALEGRRVLGEIELNGLLFMVKRNGINE